MQQYKELLQAIKERGTVKPAARANMPGTKSLFGYQFRHNLADGFPLLTTKKINFKAIVVELLWFLRGDTNIKYLVDNGVNIWNEDAYNFYLKKCRESDMFNEDIVPFNTFIDIIRSGKYGEFELPTVDYKFGDCGFQYGRVWRGWEKYTQSNYDTGCAADGVEDVDQIKNLITSLIKTPESRRHIVTAIDPAHDTELALYWCHAMFQFNCRPLSHKERVSLLWKTNCPDHVKEGELVDEASIPQYYLDCQLYQRSADVFLGVPYNIASYALLTHILAKICNMVPGEFIHTFGDVHIYDNHIDAVEEVLRREPQPLPKLAPFGLNFKIGAELVQEGRSNIDKFLNGLYPSDFVLENYNPHPSIKAELSTGLIK